MSFERPARRNGQPTKTDAHPRRTVSCIRNSIRQVLRAIRFKVIKRALRAGNYHGLFTSVEKLQSHRGIFHGIGAVGNNNPGDGIIGKQCVHTLQQIV